MKAKRGTTNKTDNDIPVLGNKTMMGLLLVVWQRSDIRRTVSPPWRRTPLRWRESGQRQPTEIRTQRNPQCVSGRLWLCLVLIECRTVIASGIHPVTQGSAGRNRDKFKLHPEVVVVVVVVCVLLGGDPAVKCGFVKFAMQTCTAMNKEACRSCCCCCCGCECAGPQVPGQAWCSRLPKEVRCRRGECVYIYIYVYIYSL